MTIRTFEATARITSAGRIKQIAAPITHTITRRRSSAAANRIVPSDARRFIAPTWMQSPASLVC